MKFFLYPSKWTLVSIKDTTVLLHLNITLEAMYYMYLHGKHFPSRLDPWLWECATMDDGMGKLCR